MARDRTAVSGASGFVARNLRALLASRGIPVTCISRGRVRLRRGEEAAASPSYSEADLLPALRRCGALVHLAGSGRAAPPRYSDSNAGLAARMARMCRRAGVRRIVYLSGLGASPRAATAYFASKYEAERAVALSGVQYTVFRPSFIMGRGDPLSRRLRGQMRRRAGRLAVPGSGEYEMQPIHVGDACEAIAAAAAGLRPGLANATVDLVGPDVVTYNELLSGVRHAGIDRIGLEEAYRAAVRDPAAEFGPDDLNILVGGFTGDFGRLRRLAGMGRFRGYGEALEAGGLS